MNRLEQIIRGLEIVNRYHGDICVEHDTIFICCDTEPAVEELVQLEEAGWRPGDDMNSWEHFV